MILDAARSLFVTSAYREISMADVAATAGVAKGTVFLYFATKEELFLGLTQREVAEWGKTLEVLLSPYRAGADKISIEPFAKSVSASVAANEPVVKLLSIMGTILEQHVDHQTAYTFKSFMKNHVVESGRLIEESVQGVSRGLGTKLYMYAFTLLVGLYPQAKPAAVMSEVLQTGDLDVFKIDLEGAFCEMFLSILRGTIG